VVVASRRRGALAPRNAAVVDAPVGELNAARRDDDLVITPGGADGTAKAVARTRSRVGTVAEAAVDSLTAGRDVALLQAEQIATRNRTRSTETRGW
jgi:hypothetical protein